MNLHYFVQTGSPKYTSHFYFYLCKNDIFDGDQNVGQILVEDQWEMGQILRICYRFNQKAITEIG